MEEQQLIPEDEYAAARRAAINGDELFLREFFRRYGDYSELKDRVGDSWFKTENSDDENARRMIFHTNQFNNWAEY